MTEWDLDQAATALWIPIAELPLNQIAGGQSKIFDELRGAVLFVMDELPPEDRLLHAKPNAHDPRQHARERRANARRVVSRARVRSPLSWNCSDRKWGTGQISKFLKRRIQV
jgi:hypothetical protein